MLRNTLLAGLSAAAFTVALASPASAQNTRTGCTVNGNVCTVTQAAGQGNTSTITISSGTDNNVIVNQTGSVETSIVQISGNTNTVNHQQAGVLDVADTRIVGNLNEVGVTQGTNASRNTATVSLTGSRSSLTILQGSNATATDRNTATITVSGNSSDIRGQIRQQSFTGTAPNSANTANLNLASTGAAGAQFNQVAQIDQEQAGNSATIALRGGSQPGAGGAVGQQNFYVFQRNRFFTSDGAGGFAAGAAPSGANNPNTGNVADVSSNGAGNTATVFQDGIQNFTQLDVNRGIAANAVAVDGANFAAGRRGGNSATISQFGAGNRALVSVGGRDAGGQQGLGNVLQLTQGTVNAAVTDVAIGHSATVYQFGQLSEVAVNQQDNTATVGNTGTRQGASTADVSQSSFFSTVTLTQNGGNDAILSQGGGSSVNNSMIVTQTDRGSTAGAPGANPFDPPGSAVAARNYVNISQAGGALGTGTTAGTTGVDRGNRINVNQNALNSSATVFQRLGSLGSRAFIAQGTGGTLEAGDTAPAFFTDSSAAVTNNSGLNQNVFANVDQGGRGIVNIRQDGASLSATIQQNNVNNSTLNFGTTGTSAPVVNVSQVGQNQSATVNQSGRNSSVTVDQRNGSEAGSTNSMTSVIQITQTGGGSASTANTNRAIARQVAIGSGTSPASAGAGTAGAGSPTGPAGDADTRAAGVYGNRIEITQTNNSTGAAADGLGGTLYAEAEQAGRGQLARIIQSGSNNTAQIFQGASATNAVAIINQSGRNNSFVINQTVANQFFRINQTGSNNQTSTGSGATNGLTAGAPTFTTTPN